MASYDFNIDILFEIFSRTDLKTMTKCRILSKEFKDLTYNSNFMKLHCERTRTLIGYLLQSRSYQDCNSLFLSIDNRGPQPELNAHFLKFLPEREPVFILATAKDGLVFCSREFRRDRFYICKPSTQQWEIVPSPNPRFYWANLGVVVLGSNPLWFKIVHLSGGVYDDSDPESESESSNEDFDYFKYKKLQYEIFDSKRWEWKQSDHLILSCHERITQEPAVSACGGLHWLTKNLGQNNILSFYGDKENWEIQSLPRSIRRRKNNYSGINLAAYEGSLALICSIKDIGVVDVWVLRDYSQSQKTWIKKHTVNLERFTKEIGHNNVHSIYNDETLFIIGSWKAVFYNLKNGQFNQIKLPSEHQTQKSIYFIQTDYEPVQLRPRKRNWDCWEPPMSNRLKFNVNISVNDSTDEAGCGWVLRNSDGDILATFSGPCEKLKDSCLAELIFIKTALDWFTKSKWFKEAAGLIIESNSKKAILMCTDACYHGPWNYMPVLSHIGALVSDIGDVNFSFVFKEANEVAVSLANVGACSSCENFKIS